MDIEAGKLYYSKKKRILFKLEKVDIDPIVSKNWTEDRKRFESSRYEEIFLVNGLYRESHFMATETLETCVEVPEGKSSLFDKAKKAYETYMATDTYMATIRAIEQQVKDNINQITK